ncbi:hypothetical protein [Streptomyces sp. NBC_01618]|uniref:hypothetical protein n=1 Tax=Streptomyces sp. NBC_01618 TaxID=2975900 RepID=UPI003868BEEB|nr:hypothetical protein OH735_19700 [Streptomyces sp. NBC_01618]
MTAVTDKDRSPSVDAADPEALPIDVEAISDVVTKALAITLSMPDRQEIDLTATQLRGALNLFVTEELGFDEDPVVRQMYRDAYRLTELNARPTAETPQFVAFDYTRELGRLTRRFVSLYRERHPEGTNDG